MYQPTLSRKFKLRRFHMEIDRKNGAILMSMLPEQIKKLIFSKNNIIFSKSFFLKKVFLQMHPSYATKNIYYNQDSTKVKIDNIYKKTTGSIITLT